MFSCPIVYHHQYEIETDGTSRFPVRKYKELRSVLEEEGLLQKNNLFIPKPLGLSTISLAHEISYVERVLNFSLSDNEKREIGLPNINKFCERALFSTGGTFLASKLALNFGVAVNAAGGSHHAKFSRGSGFCIFNDVAIAVKRLLKDKSVKNVIILDLDVHQGDGTAEIFEQDKRVFTVSIHCEKNFPAKKANSDLDIGLNAGTGDTGYLDCLSNVLEKINDIPADLIVYNAGVDVHEDDHLGHLNVSSSGIKLREKKIVDYVLRNKIPLVVTLGGGYQKIVENLGFLHSIIFKEIEAGFKN